MRQSGKLFIAALAAFSFIQSVRAETVKVFTWYVGQVQYSQSGWNDAVKKFYIDESPDFGCISGPKASSYYKDSAAGKYTEYAFVAHGANGNLGNFRYFIYCADRYSVAEEHFAVTSSKTGGRYTIS